LALPADLRRAKFSRFDGFAKSPAALPRVRAGFFRRHFEPGRTVRRHHAASSPFNAAESKRRTTADTPLFSRLAFASSRSFSRAGMRMPIDFVAVRVSVEAGASVDRRLLAFAVMAVLAVSSPAGTP